MKKYKIYSYNSSSIIESYNWDTINSSILWAITTEAILISCVCHQDLIEKHSDTFGINSEDDAFRKGWIKINCYSRNNWSFVCRNAMLRLREIRELLSFLLYTVNPGLKIDSKIDIFDEANGNNLRYGLKDLLE